MQGGSLSVFKVGSKSSQPRERSSKKVGIEKLEETFFLYRFFFSARNGRLRKKNDCFSWNWVKLLESIHSTNKESKKKFSLNNCSNGFHVVDFDLGRRWIKEIWSYPLLFKLRWIRERKETTASQVEDE